MRAIHLGTDPLSNQGASPKLFETDGEAIIEIPEDVLRFYTATREADR